MVAKERKTWNALSTDEKVAKVAAVYTKEIGAEKLARAIRDRFDIYVTKAQISYLYSTAEEKLKDYPRKGMSQKPPAETRDRSELTWKQMTIQQRVETIIEHYGDGSDASATAIAEKITLATGKTITRNAVIGFYHRNKIALAKYPLAGSRPKVTKPKSRNRITSANGLTRKRGRPKLNPRQREDIRISLPPQSAYATDDGCQILDTPALASRSLSVMELEKHDCRYPTGRDGGQHRFCGHQQTEGSQYCAEHLRRCTIS